MVKRHLLTLFVLLSGLAALQTPAHASCGVAMSAQTRAIAQGCDAAEAGHEKCAFVAEARDNSKERGHKGQKAHGNSSAWTVLRAYIFGVERALE